MNGIGGSLLPGYGGLRPPWGQSLLRSCLAAHSFPPPPPATCYPRSGHPSGRSLRKLGSAKRAKPRHAGVGAGRSAVYPEARLAARSGQRGTSGAATGPRGARSAPPNPHKLLLNQALGREIGLGHVLSILVVVANVIVHGRQISGGELGGDAVQQRLGVCARRQNGVADKRGDVVGQLQVPVVVQQDEILDRDIRVGREQKA